MRLPAPASPGNEPVTLVCTPGFGVVLAVVGAGAVRMSIAECGFFTAYPWAAASAIALFAALAVPFWLFVSARLERKSTGPLALALAWGGLVVTSVSIAGSALDDLVAKLGLSHLAADWGAALSGTSVEEAAQALGVIAIVLVARKQTNKVLDVIFYGAMVGLGFQIVEDIVYALDAVQLAGRGDQVQPVITTFLLRGLLSGAFSHTLFGALGGVGIGYLVIRRHEGPFRRVGMTALALVAAWASHLLWNSPLFSNGLRNDSFGLVLALLLKGLPPLLLTLLVVRRVHGQEIGVREPVDTAVADRPMSDGAVPAALAVRVTHGAVRVLPLGSRSRYDDEFASELYEIAAGGADWRAQVMYAVRLVDRAWRLRAELREAALRRVRS